VTGPGPLRAADAAVRAWLAGVVGDRPVTAALAEDGGSSDATDPAPVFLHLFAVAADRPLADARVPRTFRLRYLLSVTDPSGALDVLDAVLAERIAADAGGPATGPAPGTPVGGIDVEPAPAAVFTALGIPPRPALLIETTARVLPAPVTVPLVTQPVAVDPTFLRPLRGRIVGPGDIGLGAVSVAVDGSDRWVRTGADGAFRLAAPVDARGRARVRVAAKGREFTAELEPGGDEILIHCDPRET
jgi:hypothetical protein